jgi:hypothetical protein
VMASYDHILGILDRNRYFFLPIVLTRLSGPPSRPTTSQKIWNRTRTSGSVSWNSDHYTTEAVLPRPVTAINFILAL